MNLNNIFNSNTPEVINIFDNVLDIFAESNVPNSPDSEVNIFSSNVPNIFLEEESVDIFNEPQAEINIFANEDINIFATSEPELDIFSTSIDIFSNSNPTYSPDGESAGDSIVNKFESLSSSLVQEDCDNLAELVQAVKVLYVEGV